MIERQVVAVPQGFLDGIPPGLKRRLLAHEVRTYRPRALSSGAPVGDLADVVAIVPPWSQPVDTDWSFERLRRLRLVAIVGTGWDYDLSSLTRRRIAVANVRGYASVAVAEHALALMLACVRRVVEGDSEVRAGAWHEGPAFQELRGATLGVVGFGNIGATFARLGNALGMQVLVHSDRDHGRLPRGAAQVSLSNLLVSADVVSLHGSHHPGDKPLLGAAELSLMKEGSVLINTARGGLVDQIALVDALRDGRLSAAGLDVFLDEPPRNDDPLLRLPNVVLSPHRAANTTRAIQEALSQACRNVVDFLAGRPRNVINPEAMQP